MATGKITIPGWKLLWTNPSPSASFSAQTVSIDLSNYSMIMIIPQADINNIMINPVILSKGDMGLITYVYLNASANASIYIYRRIIRATNDNGITFDIGQGKPTNSTSAAVTLNNVCIPYKIFGR